MKHYYVLVLVIQCFLFGIQTSKACTCLGIPSVERALVMDDVVFIGKVIGIDKFSVPAFDDVYISSRRAFMRNQIIHSYRIIGFEVIKLYKGLKQTDTLFVRTGLGGGDCGYDFTIGETYIVYGRYKDENKPGRMSIYITTNICMRTKAYDAEEVAEIENQIRIQEKRKE